MIVSYARCTSSKSAPPVEMMTGLPKLATYWSSGVLFRSPDAI